jgi:hypothetical protein
MVKFEGVERRYLRMRNYYTGFTLDGKAKNPAVTGEQLHSRSLQLNYLCVYFRKQEQSRDEEPASSIHLSSSHMSCATAYIFIFLLLKHVSFQKPQYADFLQLCGSLWQESKTNTMNAVTTNDVH